jgi:glycosyltransferase involved in cell wall biosynthesis
LSASPPGDVTVALPTYEGDVSLLREVLTRAAAQVARPVVVVDMSVSDRVATLCASLGPSVVDRVARPDSRGVGHSRNVCVSHADTRYVLFVDSDALVEPGWAAAMRAGFEQDRVAIVGSRVAADWPGGRPPFLLDTATASDWLSLFELGPESREVPRVMGTSYALDRERLGVEPFDERLGRRPGVEVAHEEVQLALDAQAQGWRCWYAADALVRHHFDASRATWRFVLRRAHTAGREVALHPAEGLEPLPRTMTPRDHLFRALVAPAFLAGRVRGPGSAVRS